MSPQKMSPQQILADLAARGNTATATPAGLRLAGASEAALPARLREQVRTHRDEILALLARPEPAPPAASSRSVDGASNDRPLAPRPAAEQQLLVPDDGLSHVISSQPRVDPVAAAAVATTPVARPATPARSSMAAPRSGPERSATSVDRLADDRPADGDGETTIAAEAGTIGLGTVAAGALIIGAVGVAVWKGPAVLAALGTAGTPQHDEAPSQAAVDAPLDAPLEAMEYQPPAGMASASDLLRYGSGRGGIR